MRRFAQAFIDENAFAPGLPAPIALALASVVQHYNIGKGATAAVIHAADGGEPAVSYMAWGLVPRWSKEPSTPYTTVTARLERAARSRIFASAWEHRRCVVPLTGYFKWDRQRKPPWPMFVQRQDGQALLAAGLWEHWEDDAGQQLDSFTMLTDATRAIPAPLSPDGPVFVSPSTALDWLSGQIESPPQLRSRAERPALEAYYVGLAVRSPHPDDYTLLEPVDPDVAQTGPAVPWDGDGLDEDADEDAW